MLVIMRVLQDFASLIYMRKNYEVSWLYGPRRWKYAKLSFLRESDGMRGRVWVETKSKKNQVAKF